MGDLYQAKAFKDKPKETKEQRVERLKRWEQEEEAQRRAYAESAENNAEEDKPLSVIFSGHVDHGKSSMSGHLLQKLGIVDQRTVEKLT